MRNNKEEAVDMAALESIARQVGLTETSAHDVTPPVGKTVEKLLALARSSDHKFLELEADERKFNSAHWRDFRILRVAKAVERVVADIYADHIDFENIKQLFHHLELFHWDAH